MKKKTKPKHSKCQHCRRIFPLSPRQGKRHRYCNEPECRRIAKQLSLNVVQRYVKRLIENIPVKRFLTKRYGEILEELSDLVAMESL